jgi:hypothetical protein
MNINIVIDVERSFFRKQKQFKNKKKKKSKNGVELLNNTITLSNSENLIGIAAAMMKDLKV